MNRGKMIRGRNTHGKIPEEIITEKKNGGIVFNI
jgi:hypothetical protein